MDPSGRRVEWVSYSVGEARSTLPYMKAISRGNIVHWLLRPVVECMDASRPGWLMARGVRRGIGGHSDEFGLSEAYPWFIESRRALQIQQRKHEADGGSTLASSDPFSEQFFCASSAGLLGLLLDWEKHMKTNKKRTAVHLLEDWLDKCLPGAKLNGFSRWHPPLLPPPCQPPEKHVSIRDGGYCGEVWKLVDALRPRREHISLDETCKLLRALNDQSDICDTFRCWRNHLIGEVAVLLRQSLGSLPFVKRPADAILSWHLSRGAKGKLKDIDEDFDDTMDGTSEPVSLKGKKSRMRFSNTTLNMNLRTHRYLIETCKQFAGKRKFSISFDESDLGREKTLTAILSSHEKDVSAWLLPKVFPASLVVSFHQLSYEICEKKLPTSPPPCSDT